VWKGGRKRERGEDGEGEMERAGERERWNKSNYRSWCSVCVCVVSAKVTRALQSPTKTALFLKNDPKIHRNDTYPKECCSEL